MRFLFLVVLMLPGPVAAANFCHEMWFNRNLVFDRAGHCFGSALGRAVFDNGDCTPGAVTLTPEDQARVDAIRAREGNCDVDTASSELRVAGIAFRKRMIDLPVPDGEESMCIGLIGDPMLLRLGHSPGAPVGGMAEPGDNLLYQHETVEEWMFVEVFREGDVVGAGWVPFFDWGARCEQIAG